MSTREKIIYPKDLPLAYWRPAQVSLLLYRNTNELHNKERDLCDYLLKESTEMETCYCLFQRFPAVLENKDGDNLGKWVEGAMAGSIEKL